MRYFKWHPNHKKYLIPPTNEQIFKVVAAHGITMAKFERYYGMYEGFLRQIKHGDKKLSPKYWHIIFENLKIIEAGFSVKVFDVPPPNNINRKKKMIKAGGVLAELM